MNGKYVVFVSYRREGGAKDAHLIQKTIQNLGYKCFIDHHIEDGAWRKKIEMALNDAPIFLLVLSKGAFTTYGKKSGEEDVFRDEILAAIKLKKHIIPVNINKEFDGFADAQPKELIEKISNEEYSFIFDENLDSDIKSIVDKRIVPHIGGTIRKENRNHSIFDAKYVAGKNNQDIGDYGQAKKMFKEAERYASEMQLPDLWYRIAFCAYNIWIVDQNKEDENDAFNYFSQTEDSFVESLYYLGCLYENGKANNRETAFEKYKEAALKGYGPAKERIKKEIDFLETEADKSYEIGDFNKSADFYESAINLNATHLNERFAITLFKKGDYRRAKKWLEIASEQGYAESKYYLGKMYSQGIGVDGDVDKGFNHFFEAAKQGYVPAQLEVAKYYQSNKHMDLAEAWWREAAGADNFTAQIELCMMLGTKGYLEEAYSWWHKASSLAKSSMNTEMLNACINCFNDSFPYNEEKYQTLFRSFLKDVYQLGKSLNDSNEQESLCILVAENGNAEAQYQLGICSKDPKVSVKWLKMSAQQKHVESMFALGKILLTEIKVQDKNNGKFWIEEAARNNHFGAQYLWGKLLLEENDNIEYAVECLKSALKNGIVEASYELGKFYWELSQVYKEERRNLRGTEYGIILEKEKNALAEAEKYLPVEGQDAEALYLLGKVYDGLSRYEDSRKMYTKAAKKGHIGAMLSLNEDNWTEKAAQLGNTEAMYRLGCEMTYLNDFIGQAADDYRDRTLASTEYLRFNIEFKEKHGRIPRDDEYPDFEKMFKKKRDKRIQDGVAWLRKGAGLKSAECLEALGDIYKKGDIIPKDINIAIDLYKKAWTFSKDPKKIICKIGYCYYEIDNMKEALLHFKESVEQGFSKEYTSSLSPLFEGWNPNPRYMIPEIYEKMEDYAAAINIYREYAESGEERAQEQLGRIYEKGIGVKRNYDLALKWYLKANSYKAKRLKGISGFFVRLFKL